jgi:mono/diheme cytochrome c family protein
MRRLLPRFGVFGGTVAVFAGTVIFLFAVFPYFSVWFAGTEVPVPMPRTLIIWILWMVGAALFVYVTSSTVATSEFVAPIRAAVRGEAPPARRTAARAVALLVPLLAGGWIFVQSLPRTSPPAVTRQQHPGTSVASAAPYLGMTNPYSGLEGEERAEVLARGRGIYFRDCAPCHGAKHDGNGPFAHAQRLKPPNFHDPGTIATLVEDAVFWRVNEGWEGLPPVSTPWDSAMPAWHDDLTADEIWMVILSEYEDANVEPRVVGMR